MKDLMQYKNYYGSVHYSHEDRVFYGKLEFIRDLISFEGTDVKSLNEAFQEAVDDYLILCEAEGKIPDKSFKGSFNVRTGSDLHRKASIYANQHGLNLNKLVTEALASYLNHHGKRVDL